MNKRIRNKEKNTIRVICLIFKLDCWILPIFLFSALLETFLPFINIGMPALILDALSVQADKRELIMLLLVTVLANAITLFLLALLNQAKEWRSFQFSNRYRWEKTKCMLTMDYQYLEDVEFINLKQNIRHNDEDMGSMVSMPSKIAGLFRSALTIGIAFAAFLSLIIQILFSNEESHSMKGKFSSILFVLIFFVLLTIWIVRKLQKKVSQKLPAMTSETVSMNRVGMYLVETVVHNYILGKDIRIYGIDKLVVKEMERMEYNLCDFQKKTSNITSLPGAISGASSAIISGMVFLTVSIYALAGVIGVGSVVWTVGVVQQFIGSISSLIFGIGDYSIACTRVEAVLKLFNLPKIKQYMHNPIPKENSYEIEFCNVSFQYPGSEQWVLRDFSIKFEGGKRFAIVGMNGSGKTTIIKLLCRLYDPTEGVIRLNGIDIRELSEQEYQKLFSVVFQDFHLFSFSLGENLAVSTQYDSQKSKSALEKIGFAKRFEKFQKGLSTPLYRDFDENGIEVSGGEAQKIAIARALYRDAPFVILDEPTAALDPVAEQEIYENFNTLIGEKTAIYISHRLSSCRFCDKIIVMHMGKLVQKGSHEELVLQKEGKYFELWDSQAQYYT